MKEAILGERYKKWEGEDLKSEGQGKSCKNRIYGTYAFLFYLFKKKVTIVISTIKGPAAPSSSVRNINARDIQRVPSMNHLVDFQMLVLMAFFLYSVQIISSFLGVEVKKKSLSRLPESGPEW